MISRSGVKQTDLVQYYTKYFWLYLECPVNQEEVDSNRLDLSEKQTRDAGAGGRPPRPAGRRPPGRPRPPTPPPATSPVVPDQLPYVDIVGTCCRLALSLPISHTNDTRTNDGNILSLKLVVLSH